MRGQELHVEEHDAVPAEEPLHRMQREVGKVLVIDRVELVLADQLQDVGEFQGDHPIGLEQELHPRREIIQLGHLGQDVVADQEVGLGALVDHLLGACRIEELDEGWDSLGDRRLRDVRRRLDAQDRDPQGQEVL